MARHSRERSRGNSLRGGPSPSRTFAPTGSIPACHLLYLSGVPETRIAEIVSTLRDTPVLTVSDSETFTKRGGIVQIFVESGKMKFRINPVRQNGPDCCSVHDSWRSPKSWMRAWHRSHPVPPRICWPLGTALGSVDVELLAVTGRVGSPPGGATDMKNYLARPLAIGAVALTLLTGTTTFAQSLSDSRSKI